MLRGVEEGLLTPDAGPAAEVHVGNLLGDELRRDTEGELVLGNNAAGHVVGDGCNVNAFKSVFEAVGHILNHDGIDIEAAVGPEDTVVVLILDYEVFEGSFQVAENAGVALGEGAHSQVNPNMLHFQLVVEVDIVEEVDVDGVVESGVFREPRQILGREAIVRRGTRERQLAESMDGVSHGGLVFNDDNLLIIGNDALIFGTQVRQEVVDVHFAGGHGYTVLRVDRPDYMYGMTQHLEVIATQARCKCSASEKNCHQKGTFFHVVSDFNISFSNGYIIIECIYYLQMYEKKSIYSRIF